MSAPLQGAAGAETLGARAAVAGAPLQAWWRSLAARERLGLGLASTVLVVYLLWAVAVAPAWRTVRQAPAQLDALELQLQQMQALAAEAQALRATPPVNPDMAAAALRAATDRLGERARLTLQGERATLTLNGVSPQALRDWLTEARSGARARPVEANLTRGEVGYSGGIVLAIGGPT